MIDGVLVLLAIMAGTLHAMIDIVLVSEFTF